MIILDTNVVSALMRATPEQRVIDWMDGIPQELLWISTITIFEITQGVELLPVGKKKKGSLQQFESMLRHHYRNNIIGLELIIRNQSKMLRSNSG